MHKLHARTHQDESTDQPGARRARPPAKESSLYVKSVEKAMTVLTAFNGSSSHLTLSQIASITGMDLSSAQRFIYTLTRLGYLRKDEVSKAYALAPRLFDFTYNYLASNGLIYRATPYVQQVSKETEETTNVSVLDGSDIVFVLRFVSRHVLDANIIVGTRLPAYCTAPGLAILSALPDEEVGRILDSSELVRHTPHTVTDPQAIRQRLARVREQGFARSKEEYFLGDISTAAPILDANGRVAGAINVAVATTRWRGEVDELRLSGLVIAAAAAISGRR